MPVVRSNYGSETRTLAGMQQTQSKQTNRDAHRPALQCGADVEDINQYI